MGFIFLKTFVMELAQRCSNNVGCTVNRSIKYTVYTHHFPTGGRPSQTDGDLYYKDKEFETHLKNKKPGDLSDELRVALGMPTGLVCWRI